MVQDPLMLQFGIRLPRWRDTSFISRTLATPVPHVGTLSAVGVVLDVQRLVQGGGGPLRGLSQWNLDLTVSKEIKFTERFNARFISTFSNIFNHPWFHDPYMDLQDPGDWGTLSGAPFGVPTQINSPRQIEFGLRFGF